MHVFLLSVSPAVSEFGAHRSMEIAQRSSPGDLDKRNGDSSQEAQKKQKAKLEGPQATQRTMGRNYGLFFGTSSYADKSLADLQNAIVDANAIANALSADYGFETEVIENPSRSTVPAVIRKYCRKTFGPDDQLFVFFAGHGCFDETLRIAYLTTSDSQNDDDSRASFISAPELTELIDAIPCRHIFLCIDACASGSFNHAVARNLRTQRATATVYDKMSYQEIWKKRGKFRTRKMLTAASETEAVNDGYPGQHSPFAAGILELLRRSSGQENFLDFAAIVHAVERIKPGPGHGDFGSDEPGSDFFFIPLAKSDSVPEAAGAQPKAPRPEWLLGLEKIPAVALRKKQTSQLERLRDSFHEAIQKFCFEELDGFSLQWGGGTSSEVHGFQYDPARYVMTVGLQHKTVEKLNMIPTFTFSLELDKVVLSGNLDGDKTQLLESKYESVTDEELRKVIRKYFEPVLKRKTIEYEAETRKTLNRPQK